MTKPLIDQAQRDIKRAEMFPKIYCIAKHYSEIFKGNIVGSHSQCKICNQESVIFRKAEELL